MSLRIDTRGVSEQIGVLLIFAMLIVSMSLYQAHMVPADNKETEFNHNQHVQTQLQDLRDNIIASAATGTHRSVSITLGTTYPNRAFFVNPAAPSGHLQTEGTESNQVNISITGVNATAAGDYELGEYWDGSEQAFSTGSLTYTPTYHEYQAAPTTIYENSVLYNQFDTGNANLTQTQQTVIEGRRIQLITLNGSLSEASQRGETVDIQALSASSRTVAVRNDTHTISITLSTQLPNETWTDLLSDEYVENGGYIVNQSYEQQAGAYNRLTIELQKGVTYELRLAKVGINTDAAMEDAHYITRVGEKSRTVGPDGRGRLSVEIRDRYNTPVSNANVTLNASVGRFEDSTGTVLGTENVTVRTDDDGRATVWHNVSQSLGVHTVTGYMGATATDSLPEKEKLTFSVVNTGGAEGAEAGKAVISVVSESVAPTPTGCSDPCEGVNFTVNNTGSTALNLTGVQLNYVTLDDQGGKLRDGPDAIANVTLSGEMRNVTATETEAPVFFDNPLQLPSGTTPIQLTFGTSYPMKNEDTLIVSVTFYFEGGFSATYSVYLFG